MQQTVEFSRDLVLVGGGHAHALALRMLAMKPIAGLRITLISPASHTPYSGMLPGLVAGHYSFEETHIDLARLCQWAGVRFLCAEVTNLDPQARRLQLAGRPPVEYDVLSIDIGSQPELDSVPGAREFAVPVKPVAQLWQRWQELDARMAGNASRRIAVVGGGAGSVELILAMAQRLRQRAVRFALYCGGEEILQGYNSSARRAAMKALRDYGVSVHLGQRVERVAAEQLFLDNGEVAVFDALFWCTAAAAAGWIADSGLAVDDRGFLLVRDTLQALDDDRIFAAGDIATQRNHPRPKAGVYAVRQGPVLAHNLRASLMARALREHRPQQRFLSLVSLGDKKAVADRGVFSAAGAWVWRWKDSIDSRFMRQFSELSPMAASTSTDLLGQPRDAQVHCGGCGAKVGANQLGQVLQALRAEFPDNLLADSEAEDAAPLITGSADIAYQSVDVLRQITDDPWLMGRIAANHALSDLYASGLRPVNAMAVVTLPFARPELQARELRQLLAGALHEFSRVGCVLSGGHSMQGPEMALGFAVTGVPISTERGALSKRGAHTGDALVLTKPLGTGCLFAAHMQLAADGRDITAALDTMLQSNARASQLAVSHGASACTDITGFGLFGHLLEMLLPGQSAQLDAAQLPLLSGAREAMASGIYSTMHDANQQSASAAGVDADVAVIGCDPQTSGGLLIAVEAERADALCRELMFAGYVQAARVGTITADAAPPIVVAALAADS